MNSLKSPAHISTCITYEVPLYLYHHIIFIVPLMPTKRRKTPFSRPRYPEDIQHIRDTHMQTRTHKVHIHARTRVVHTGENQGNDSKKRPQKTPTVMVRDVTGQMGADNRDRGVP